MSAQTLPFLPFALPEIGDEEIAEVVDTLKSGWVTTGPKAKRFEAAFTEYLGDPSLESMAVNSATAGLHLALEALGIGPGDEVITTPFTFFATAEAVSALGALPVFVDIDPATYNMDMAQVEARITPRTKAIIPVHLYGHAAEMQPLMAMAHAYGLKVLEDVAQAFGGEYAGLKLGTIGHMGAYSFFPSKNLGGYGDGGLLATNDDELAETARMLRVHGARKKYHNEMVGYNSRLDELQAAVLRVKLPRLDAQNALRRQVAARYAKLFQDMPDVVVPVEAPYAKHVYHQYTVRLRGKDRDELQRRMAEAGVATMVYYPVPVHKLPVYQGLDYRLPKAELAQREVLSLPIWPAMQPTTQQKVREALAKALPVSALPL
jgi:dTDP-4-amino-4,6-dideoxygalactose transaminase